MYQFRLNSDKNELANIIVAEANKLLELSPFLFRSLNDDDSLEEGIKPLSDQEIEHDAYNHLKDGSLLTMKNVPRYPVDSSTGGIGTISYHHIDLVCTA